MKAPVRKIRCVVYTRKSSEEGLEMEFNSLDAQREAGLAYIQSQKSEGWMLIGDRYDDGGFSGGSMQRPALQRLLRDVERGVIDVIIVYKVDRLSRSLTDFARIVEVFDKHNASFVSITQQFNTTTSMGRLTLNILLSFAQFEREVIGERIRDKFAASRARGMWMGGIPPLGYDVGDRKLVVNEIEAELVRLVFARFLRLGSATKLAQELRRAGHTTKCWTTQDGKHRPGKPIDKGAIYKILGNRIYLGEAVHKGSSFPGEQAAIIDAATWDKVHTILADNRVARSNGTRAQTPALLRGLIFAPGGHTIPSGSLRVLLDRSGTEDQAARGYRNPEAPEGARSHSDPSQRRQESLAAVCEDLSAHLAGWKAYFRIAGTPRFLAGVGKWGRHRLRALQLKH